MRILSKLFLGSIVGGAGYLVWQRYRNDLLAAGDKAADKAADQKEPNAVATQSITDIEPEPISQFADEVVVVTAAEIPDLDQLAHKNVP